MESCRAKFIIVEDTNSATEEVDFPHQMSNQHCPEHTLDISNKQLDVVTGHDIDSRGGPILEYEI